MSGLLNNPNIRAVLVFLIMAGLLLVVAKYQSWSVALAIVNLCIISSIMALGVNIQWGYAGLFNVGTMGFAALGGVAAVLVSKAPVYEAWAVGGTNLALAGLMVALTIAAMIAIRRMVADDLGRAVAVDLVYVPITEGSAPAP